jgi:hypothetical protein
LFQKLVGCLKQLLALSGSSGLTPAWAMTKTMVRSLDQEQKSIFNLKLKQSVAS